MDVVTCHCWLLITLSIPDKTIDPSKLAETFQQPVPSGIFGIAPQDSDGFHKRPFLPQSALRARQKIPPERSQRDMLFIALATNLPAQVSW